MSLNFRGTESSKTYFGASLSVLANFAILVYTVVQLINVYNQEYELKRTVQVNDIVTKPSTYTLTTDNFNFALNLRTIDEDLQKNMRKYFRVVLLYKVGYYDYEIQS